MGLANSGLTGFPTRTSRHCRLIRLGQLYHPVPRVWAERSQRLFRGTEIIDRGWRYRPGGRAEDLIRRPEKPRLHNARSQAIRDVFHHRPNHVVVRFGRRQ